MAAHVLVADDEPQILTMVSEILRSRGYTFDLATDGLQALECARRRKPDLLVTDVMMPKLDGWTLVRELRADPTLARLPVIFVTALTAKDDRLRAFRLGADDYINKPFQVKDLLARIVGAIDRPRAPVAASTAGLNGDLSQVALSTLLVLIEMERKTGVLQMRATDGRTATLFLRDGRIIDARLDGAGPSGAECVYHLLSWTSGKFEFAKRAVDGPDRIQASTTHLLMEGARRSDEASANATAADPNMDDEAIAEWNDDARTPMMVAAKLAGLVHRSAHSSNPPPFASVPQIPLAELMALVAAEAAPDAEPPAPSARPASPAAAITPAEPAAAIAPAAPTARAGSRDRAAEPAEATPQVAMRATTWPWLAAALIAAAAGAVSFFVPSAVSASANRSLVKGDAVLIATAIDQTAESAHMRAEGFAALPMLRAGIDTDAATLQDMASNEALMKTAPNEIIEIFQTRDGHDTSVLRMPASAPPLEAASVRTDGTTLWVVARTAIKSQSGALAGTIAVAEPADITAAKRSLAEHATGAALTTTPRLVVVSSATPGTAPMTLPLPSKTIPQLSLVVDAAPAADLPSLVPIVRLACFAVGALLLAAYIMLRARAPRIAA